MSNDRKYRFLLVDDNLRNLSSLTRTLTPKRNRHPCHLDSELEQVETGEAALEVLKKDPDKFDLVLLDIMMPGISGLDVLRIMRKDSALKNMLVILQTGLGEPENMQAGLEAGAQGYITKPLDKDQLLSLIKSVLEERDRNQEMLGELNTAASFIQSLNSINLRFKSIQDARDNATMLAKACPNPEAHLMVLTELLLNAVEHGNAGITYDEKSELNRQGKLQKEVERRLSLPENANKIVDVAYRKTDTKITFVITDVGKGFDPTDYMEFSAKRALDNHGRGIAMAKKGFSSLQYIGCGNTVEATIDL